MAPQRRRLNARAALREQIQLGDAGVLYHVYNNTGSERQYRAYTVKLV
jgi:hypothetical protein